MEKFGRRIIPAFGHTVRRCRHTSSSRSLPSVLSKNSIKIEIIVKVGGLLWTKKFKSSLFVQNMKSES